MDLSALLNSLNDEQRPVATQPLGSPIALVAGAGSGKTKTLTAKVAYLMHHEKLTPRKICCITFTNKAAGEIRERVGVGDDPHGPRIGTIHSLALSAIRRAPKGFGLGDKVTPLDDYDQNQMIRRLITEAQYEEIVNPYLVLEKISYHRARGIGFTDDYTADIDAKAVLAHGGYHKLTSEEQHIWRAYEKEKACHPPGTLVDVVVTPPSVNRWSGFTPAVVESRPIETLNDDDRVVSWRRKDGRCIYHGRHIKKETRDYKGFLLCIKTKEGSVKVTPNHQVWTKFNKKAHGKHIVYLMADKERFRIGTTQLVFNSKTRRVGLTGRLAGEGGDRAWVLGVFDSKLDAYIAEQVYSYRFGIPQTVFSNPDLSGVWDKVDSKEGATRLLHSLGLLVNEPMMTRTERTWGWFRFFKTAACNLRPEIMSLPAKTRPVWNKGVQNTWRIPDGNEITSLERSRYNGSVYSLEVEEDHSYIANGVVVANCNSVVDFDDMIHLVVRRGRTDDKWLAGLQRAFEFVLMDEAQDTNVAQWEFVNMLLPPTNLNLMCTGDVSQSIYGFNGAAPEILLNFTKGWRDVVPKQYKLQQNYRSVPEVVSLANRIQAQMTDTIPLKMESYRGKHLGHSGKIVLRQATLPRDLAASISQDISLRSGGTDYRGMAILIRAGSQVRDIETELVKNRIPYIIRGTMGLLQTEEVKDVLSYLKLASNPHDFSALCRSVSVPKRGVGDSALKKLHEASGPYEGDMLQTILQRNVVKLVPFVRLIQEIQSRSHNPSDAIDYILKAIKYDAYLEAKYKKYPDKIEIKQQNLVRLKEMIESLMAERDMTIEDVVFQLTMQDQKDTTTEGKVVVSTIHASKGLEWNTVYLMGLYEGSLPHKWSQSDSEIEEERRLFYVGCTRAKDMLVLGVPAMIDPYNRGPQFVAPSRFLTELGIIK